MHFRLSAIWKFRKTVSVQYGSAVLQTHNLIVLLHWSSFTSAAEEFSFPVGSKFRSSLFNRISLQELDLDFFSKCLEKR